MTPHAQTVTDVITQPTPAVTFTGSVAAASFFGLGLPEIIQIFTAIYAVLLVVHKLWQMYKDFKGSKNKHEDNS